ncbi:MAG: Gfo/Idh/MocA family oxidoreductase [Candidatus Omnitrophica bacterium]|jgi:hypothetical protein|nr:Gfo/Idh/MocA family oxidoreductase [Candidatus Omnitrophota bacterium]
MNFGIIGDGYAAQRHKKAIKYIGGNLVWIYDPPKYGGDEMEMNLSFASKGNADWVVITSPNYLHYIHCKMVLRTTEAKIICEKPLCLPWEPIIDDDRINICLQLRYIENLPKQAESVRAFMVRNEQFFNSWKGNPKLSGGNFYEFFIHYIDLAILLNADFEGAVWETGEQERKIIISYKQEIDIMKIDMQSLYDKMYEEILDDNGIKPRDIFYLKYALDKFSNEYGFRKSGVTNRIEIGKDQLR